MTKNLTADEAMRLARSHANKGDLQAAASVYKAVLDQNPRNKKARKALNALMKAAPAGATKQAEFARLLQLYEAGHKDQAMALGHRLSREYPDEPMPLNIVGAIHTERENHAEAIAAFEQSLALVPDFPDALNNLGLAYKATGNNEAAVDCFRRLSELQPNNAALLGKLASSMRDCGEIDDALAAIERSVSLNPRDLNTQIELGLILKATNRLDQAAGAFRRALELDSKNRVAHENIANIFNELGDRHSAIAWYRQTIDLAPNHAPAYELLAICLLQENQTDEAIAALNRALELKPDSAQARHFLNVAKGIVDGPSPEGYVETLFDEYANRFDDHLVDRLGYRSPQILRQLLDDCGAVPATLGNAADLGCGTGLSGAAIRDLADSITGIDLSQKMLDKAEKTGIYQVLHKGDIAEVLARLGQHFDLFVATEVLLYMGDLKPVLQAISDHSQPGSLLAFTTETPDSCDIEIRPSGRYAHSKDHITAVTEKFGFELLAYREDNLRTTSGGAWVTGGYYVMRYTG